MKKKRFLSLLLTIVMLVSTLAMSGCGTQNQSANGNYDGELVYDHSMELQYAEMKIQQLYLSSQSFYLFQRECLHHQELILTL